MRKTWRRKQFWTRLQNRGSVELAHTKKHGGAELAHHTTAEQSKTKITPRYAPKQKEFGTIPELFLLFFPLFFNVVFFCFSAKIFPW